MPQVEVPADDRVEIIANPAAFSSYAVNHISGPRVFIAHNAGQTREQGQIIDEGDRTILRNLNREPVYAKTPAGASDPAIIDVRRTGFLLQYAPRKSVTVDGSVDIGSATIDQFNATAPVDIQAQSLSTVASDTQIESSQSIVEINADQTTTNTGGFSTSLISPDAGEVWTLSGLYLNAPEIESNVFDGQSHSFTVETESEGVEIGFGQVTRTDSSTGGLQRLRYQGGTFTDDPEAGDSTTSTSALTAARDDILGTRFDSGNGLVIDYRNNTQADQTGDRIIRAQFEVTQIA